MIIGLSGIGARDRSATAPNHKRRGAGNAGKPAQTSATIVLGGDSDLVHNEAPRGRRRRPVELAVFCPHLPSAAVARPRTLLADSIQYSSWESREGHRVSRADIDFRVTQTSSQLLQLDQGDACFRHRAKLRGPGSDVLRRIHQACSLRFARSCCLRPLLRDPVSDAGRVSRVSGLVNVDSGVPPITMARSVCSPHCRCTEPRKHLGYQISEGCKGG